MYYAFIAGSIATVFNNWEAVDKIYRLYPYPVFRKFLSEEDAWNYVNTHKVSSNVTSVTAYGDILTYPRIQMTYMIRDGFIAYEMKPKGIKNMRFTNTDPLIKIDYRSKLAKVVLKGISLNDDLITNHLIAIVNGLKVIGPFIDVDIVVPNHSIFYALTAYTGEDRRLVSLLSRIKNRTARYAVTIRRW